jgi:hypothetical protein
MSNDEPHRVLLGTFESGTNLTIPRSTLQRAEQILDRTHHERETAAAKERLKVMQSFRGRNRLRKALRLVFGRKFR